MNWSFKFISVYHIVVVSLSTTLSHIQVQTYPIHTGYVSPAIELYPERCVDE